MIGIEKAIVIVIGLAITGWIATLAGGKKRGPDDNPQTRGYFRVALVLTILWGIGIAIFLLTK